MKTRLIATLTALTLTALAGTSVRAEDSEATLEWQKPGYVMDVIVVTAPRPKIVTAIETADQATDATATATATENVELAWQQPGYVEEVVIAKASRSEVLAEARKAAIKAALARQAYFKDRVGASALGAPGR